MALADRSFVWESATVSLTDTQGTVSTGDDVSYDLIKVFKTLDINITTEMMEANAAHDPVDATAKWHCPRPRSRSCTMELTGVVDATVGGSHFINFIDLASNQSDGNYIFRYSGPIVNSSGATEPCFRFVCAVSIDSVDLRYPGEDAEQSIRLSNYGPPSVYVAATGTTRTLLYPQTGALL